MNFFRKSICSLFFVMATVLSLVSLQAKAGCYYDLSQFYSDCEADGNHSVNMIVIPQPENYPYYPHSKIKLLCYDHTLNQDLGMLDYLTASGPYSAASFLICPAEAPDPSRTSPVPNSTNQQCGSIVHTDTQTLVEKIPLTGIPFELVYSSYKVAGRKDLFKTTIAVTPPNFVTSSEIVSENLKISIAGQIFTTSFTPASDITYQYTWNGNDGNGDPVQGPQMAQIEVTEGLNFSHTMNVAAIRSYTPPWWNENKTTKFKGKIPSKKEIVRRSNPSHSMAAPVTSSVVLGTVFGEDYGLGGWSVNINHKYDKIRKILYKGDGSTFKTKSNLTSTGYWIVSEDRSEVYFFDSSDRHIQTKTALDGAVKWTFSYNGNNQLTSVTDSYSNATTIQYTSNVISSITSPYSQVTTINVDGNGYIDEVTNPNSEVYEMTYDADGLLLTFEKPTGVVSTMTYDADGRLLTDSSSAGSSLTLNRTDSGQNYTITSTTEEGRVTSHAVTNGLNFTRTDFYPNNFSKVSTEYYGDISNSITDSNYYSYSMTKDNDVRFGEIFKMPSSLSISDGGGYYSATYSETPTLTDPDDPFSLTSLTSAWNINYKLHSSTYTASTKTLVETSPEGRMKTTVFNTHSDPVSIQMASLNAVNIDYDTNGRIEEVSQGARSTNFTYHTSNGLVATIVNALSQTTSFTYDLAGRVATQTLPDSRVISYDYDANGNVTSITPPGQPAHEMTYNGFDYVSSYIPPTVQAPNNVTTTYTYNNDRELTQISRPDSQSILFNYNSTTGNMDSITLPNGTRNFTYSNGNLYLSESEDFISRYFTFSGTRLTNEYVTDGTVNYSLTQYFNSDLLPSSEAVTAGITNSSIAFAYDDDNLLVVAGDANYTRASGTGFLGEVSLGDMKQYFSYSYTYGELSSIQAEYFDDTTTYQESVTRDDLGRIVTKTEQYGSGASNVYAYTYDSAGRLTTITLNGNPKSSYSYDSNSNRTSQTLNGVTTTATYDDQDRLITFGNKTFTYNMNGEVTSMVTTSPATTTDYTYDVFGNLKSVDLPSKTVNYKVDAHNRRFAKYDGTTLETFFVWNSKNQLIGLLDSSGNLTDRYVYGSKSHVPDYVEKGSDKFMIVTDHLGSPVQVINVATGTIAQEVKYDEFGNILSDTNPGFIAFGFAGCLYDQDTKLCRFGARDYDPSIGRWLSKDPIMFAGGDTNLYGYVFNDPINFIDSSGKIAVPVAAVLIGGTISGLINGVATYATGGTVKESLMAFGSGFLGGAVGALGVATGGLITGLAAIPIGVGTAVLTSTYEGGDPTGIHQLVNRNNKMSCE